MELLIVIAVIALLLSILIPAVVGVQIEMLRHQCRSNLQQIGKALISYSMAEGSLGNGGGRFLPSLDMSISGNAWNAPWPTQGNALRRSKTADLTGNNSQALWLLVDADKIEPENMVCPEAGRSLGHRPALRTDHTNANRVADGEGRFQFNTISYSYITQVGYSENNTMRGGFSLANTDSTKVALIGDRNPYCMGTVDGVAVNPSTNSTNHRGEGQNFLLLNQQALWVEKLNVDGSKMDLRLNSDHPYLPGTATKGTPGVWDSNGNGRRFDKNDTFLVDRGAS